MPTLYVRGITPEQMRLIKLGAILRGKTLKRFVLDVLLEAAPKDNDLNRRKARGPISPLEGTAQNDNETNEPATPQH